MVLSVPTNTYNYLQAATRDGLVPRYLVYMNAKNRNEEGVIEHIGIWNDGYAKTLPVIRPDNGEVANRVYQPGADLLQGESVRRQGSETGGGLIVRGMGFVDQSGELGEQGRKRFGHGRVIEMNAV